MSDATDMFASLVPLLKGRERTFDYRTEAGLEQSTPASPNKRTTANCAWLIDSLNHGRIADCHKILDWWLWLATQPFMQNESLTPEEAYRALHAYPHYIVMGIARQLDRSDAYDAARKLAKSHVGWLLIGLAAWHGRKVVNHQLDKVGVPVVLVGDKTGRKRHTAFRYCVQPGMRGWIRNRKKNQPANFLFPDHDGLSLIVYQALEWDVPRKGWADQQNVFKETSKRWPDIPVWGLDNQDRELGRAFADNVRSPVLAAAVAKWLTAPRLKFQFDRYADASIFAFMFEDQGSSTDPLMVDGTTADERTWKTSGADAWRKEEGRVTGWEELGAYGTFKPDKPAGTLRKVAKPVGVEKAWSLLSDGQSVTVSSNQLPVTVEPELPAFRSRAPEPKPRWYEVS